MCATYAGAFEGVAKWVSFVLVLVLVLGCVGWLLLVWVRGVAFDGVGEFGGLEAALDCERSWKRRGRAMMRIRASRLSSTILSED